LIITVQTGQPWNINDQSNDFSGTGELADRWNLFGSLLISVRRGELPDPVHKWRFGWLLVRHQSNGNTVNLSDAQTAADWALCQSHATGALQTSLNVAVNNGTGGCYVSKNGKSVLLPNGVGQFGTMGRNVFRDLGSTMWTSPSARIFHFTERFRAQFRVEMFNVFNHPNFANPNGATAAMARRHSLILPW